MLLADFVCDHAVHVLVTSQMESDGHLHCRQSQCCGILHHDE